MIKTEISENRSNKEINGSKIGSSKISVQFVNPSQTDQEKKKTQITNTRKERKHQYQSYKYYNDNKGLITLC